MKERNTEHRVTEERLYDVFMTIIKQWTVCKYTVRSLLVDFIIQTNARFCKKNVDQIEEFRKGCLHYAQREFGSAEYIAPIFNNAVSHFMAEIERNNSWPID